MYRQPDNPSDEERKEMIKIALEQVNRMEDYENLIELLRPPPDITTLASSEECRGLRVGIIGGGVAGLAAAFELRKLGFQITIFESQTSRIGGRIYTHYFDKEKRLYGELGAMRIPVIHETTWHYINLFELDTRPYIQNNENTFTYIRNERAKNDSNGEDIIKKIYPEFPLTPMEKLTPWQAMLEYALETPLVNMSTSVRKEILEIKKVYSESIIYADSLSIRMVLKTMGLSQGAIELLSGIVSLLGSFYNNSFSENLQESYTVDWAYRYAIDGGFVRLPLSFYRSFRVKKPKEYKNLEPRGIGTVIWKNGKTVFGIHKEEDNTGVLLEYRDETSLREYRERFDFVICAIPFSTLRNVTIYPMFSTRKMQAISEVSYCAAQKTIFKCNQRFWEKLDGIVGGGSNTDFPISTIWYPSTHTAKNHQSGVLLASYNLTQNAIRLGNLEDKIRFQHIKRQVEAVHGLPKGYLNAIVEDFKTVQWDKETGFYGGFCYFMPNQKKLFSYAMTQPEYNGRVYFAGEHISSTHGWQQGSLNSAMKAANAIATYCKKERV